MAMKVIMARDPLFEDIKKFVQQQKVASLLGFNRARQILEQLEQAGIISPMKNGQRKVL